MKKSSVSWSVKQYKKMVERGKISFDYPIQRAGEQWDLEQKSLLIHSYVDDFPVPALYAKVIDDIWYIIDGKQRLTNTVNFINGEYALDIDTPDGTVEGKTVTLAETIFEELSEDTQDKILDYMLLIYKIDEATDEEIEELFYRLNNGTPLTKQQKSKAKMGSDWAIKIKSLVDHPFTQEKANFTKAQIKRADNEAALLQTMMLMDKHHELKSISSNHVFDYTAEFKTDSEYKEELVQQLTLVLDYLDKAFEEKEKLLFKKVHFPMMLITAQKAMLNDIQPEEFYDWAMEFKKSFKGEGEIETNYKEFSGQGSVKKENALGRISEMEKHFEIYFQVSV